MRSAQKLLVLQLALNCLAGSAFAQVNQAQLKNVNGPPNGPMMPGGVHPKVKAAPPHGPLKLDLPEPDYSLWFRYYQAGEDATITHHDADLAKKYYMAALGEIEKKPPSTKDMFIAVKLSALEQGLEDLYPKDWSKQDANSEATDKLRKEQVETLYRIARVNDRIVPHNDLLYTKSQERYQNARKAYEKIVEAKKQAVSAPK